MSDNIRSYRTSYYVPSSPPFPSDPRLRDVETINPLLPSAELTNLIKWAQENAHPHHTDVRIPIEKQIELNLRVDTIVAIRNRQELTISNFAKATEKAFLGEGVYGIQNTPTPWEIWNSQSVTIGPAIVSRELFKAAHPELAEEIKALEERIYKDIGRYATPCSPKHEVDLVAFAATRGLEPPLKHFTSEHGYKNIQDPIKMAKLFTSPMEQIDVTYAQISPYVLTDVETKEIAENQQFHMDIIIPVQRCIVAKHYDSTTEKINTAKEFFQAIDKFKDFQKHRLVHINPGFDHDTYMSQVMSRISPEMRQNPDEMLKIIKEYPEAYFELSTKLLTPDFISQMFSISPAAAHAMANEVEVLSQFDLQKPKLWLDLEMVTKIRQISHSTVEAWYSGDISKIQEHIDHLQTLTQNDRVVGAHIFAAMTPHSPAIETDTLYFPDDAMCYMSLLDINPQYLKYANPTDLYFNYTKRAFDGHGVYSESMGPATQDHMIGPAITMRAFLRDTYPELKETFDEMDITLYNSIRETVSPVSEQHEADLIHFADAHGLERPEQTFAQGMTHIETQDPEQEERER